MLENGTRLLERYPGRQLDELVDGDTIFEVLEQGCDGHTCPAEHPSAADTFRIVLDRSALVLRA